MPPTKCHQEPAPQACTAWDCGPESQTPGAAEPAEANGAVEAPEAKGAEADGTGGHADAEGQNVDHQFDGEE